MSGSSATQTATQQQSPAGLLSGHSGRLVYAKPEDLPSFPPLGLKKDDAAASAAASLGWASHKPVTNWTPDKLSTSASKAALLANDYKMAPLWEPERSAAGHKAASLAAEDALLSNKRSPAPAKTWENSAANQAFQASRDAPRAPVDTMTSLSRQESMRAAKGAMARGPRPRARSSPSKPPAESYPDYSNAAANALSAATLAHKPSTTRANMVDFPTKDTGSVPITTMNRLMYTSNPPVKPELDERNHETSLRASVLAMAKQMYSHQQKAIDATKQAQMQQSASTGRSLRADSSIDEPRPMRFNNLQEAAYKLAQERLARLHEEHQKNRDFQEYYGSPTSPRKGFANKLRRRVSSDDIMLDDKQRSQQIRKEMSIFSTKISEVDEKKRTKDREALLAAAQRNVKAKLQGMDEKMYRETGRVNPTVRTEWELKAHAAAQSRSDARKNDNTGKVDIGGGKFVNQKAVDEIAVTRVQPLLDEIDEKAEAERERQAAIKTEKEQRAAAKAGEKEQKAAAKAEEKKQKVAAKAEHREREAMLKKQEKIEKENQVALRAEEKTKQERPKPVNIETDHAPATLTSNKSPSSQESSPGSPTSKVRNWLKSRFNRSRTKSASDPDKEEAKQPGFVGGHNLTRLHTDGTKSMTSLEHDNATSMREVALASVSRDTPSPTLESIHLESSHRDSTQRDSKFIELIE